MKRPTPCSFAPSTDESGFTLVELLITMAISLLVMGIIYTAYIVYQRQQTNQNEIVRMQQDVRSVMNYLMEDIRMAGYDPPNQSNAGIVTATATTLNFTKDTTNVDGSAANGDGLLNGPNENVTYGFAAGADVAPADGVADSGAAQFTITTGGVTQPIANNITAIEFLYTFPDGTTATAPAAPWTVDDIRSVTITLLARTGNRDPEYTDNNQYQRPSGNTWGPFGDNFRRRLLTATVKCRNMGL